MSGAKEKMFTMKTEKGLPQDVTQYISSHKSNTIFLSVFTNKL